MTLQALIFDVFGTCVDWRSSVAREVAAAVPGVDAVAFAMAWRAEYDPAMARIRDGARGMCRWTICTGKTLTSCRGRSGPMWPTPMR